MREKGGTREVMSPRIGVLIGEVTAEDHGDVKALLLHSPTHAHTVRRTTVGVESLVAGEVQRVTRGSVHDMVSSE